MEGKIYKVRGGPKVLGQDRRFKRSRIRGSDGGWRCGSGLTRGLKTPSRLRFVKKF